MTRRSIHADTFAHQNPIPVATRIGPLLTSGVLVGYDAGTRDLPADLGQQVRNLFTHIGAALEAAGGSWEHVAKISFFANDPDARGIINPSWEAHFPDPASRPSRHTHVTVDGGRPRVTCDFIAYIDD